MQMGALLELCVWIFPVVEIIPVMLKMVVKILHMGPDRSLVHKPGGVRGKCCDLADRALCGVRFDVGVVRVGEVEMINLYGMTMGSRPTWPSVLETGLLGLETGLLEGGPARPVMWTL